MHRARSQASRSAVVAARVFGLPGGGEVAGQGRVDPVHARAEAGEQPDPGRVLQHRRPLLLADPGEPARHSLDGGERRQDIRVGDAVEQADRREQPPGLLGQVGEGVGDARPQRRQPARARLVPPGSGAVPRSPASRSAGSAVSRRGKVSRIASGWPSSQSSSSPNDRRSRRCLRGRVGGEQMPGVLGGLGPVQPAHRDAADLAEPVLPRPAGDDHRAGGVVADPVQELPQPRAAGLVQRRGRPGRVGHLADRLEVVPHQQRPVLRQQPLAPPPAAAAPSRRAKSAPNTSRPIPVITPSRPKDATPGSNECQHTSRGSSTPPVSRHHRANPLASSVLPVPPGPGSTTTRCSRAAASSW